MVRLDVVVLEESVSAATTTRSVLLGFDFVLVSSLLSALLVVVLGWSDVRVELVFVVVVVRSSPSALTYSTGMLLVADYEPPR